MTRYVPVQICNGGSKPPPPLDKWPWVWVKPADSQPGSGA